MKVLNHRIADAAGDAFPYVESPNRGGALAPRFLVMHYTASRGGGASVDWLARKEARASAHLVIDRDGSVTQLVPFNRVAWHAGRSRWLDVNGLNGHSVGIELANAGKLVRRGSRWVAWFGDEIDDDEVVEATHRNETSPAGWHAFPAEQIEAAVAAAGAIVGKYPIEAILGHDDVSPGRKVDPGPAFPMASFRSRVLGRLDEEEPRFETTTTLNIRGGPGTVHERLPEGPLAPGTKVEILDQSGVWRFVEVLDGGGEADLQGWVHGRYLSPVG